MSAKETIHSGRRSIDEIDRKMVALLAERMEVVRQIAACKREINWPLEDPAREERVIHNAVAAAPAAIKPETAAFMRTLIELSKAHQRSMDSRGPSL